METEKNKFAILKNMLEYLILSIEEEGESPIKDYKFFINEMIKVIKEL